MSPVRRLAIAMTLCLAGGAAATVLVAWWFVARESHGSRRPTDADLALSWPGAAPPPFPAQPDGLTQYAGVGTRFTTASAWSNTHYCQGWRLECGWPLLALDLETFTHVARGSEPDVIERWPSFPRPNWIPASETAVDPLDRLPTRPIPLGFALDTLSYAALLAALFLAPPRLRRALRLRRGLCPACAYNLTGNTTGTCPECGAHHSPTA